MVKGVAVLQLHSMGHQSVTMWLLNILGHHRIAITHYRRSTRVKSEVVNSSLLSYLHGWDCGSS